MEQQQHRLDFFRQVFELYGKFGIRSMTMDDIAGQLGISKKTIYQHVKDKADLIHRVIDLDMEANRSFIEGVETSGENAIEDLVTINEQMHRRRRHLSPTFYYDLRKYFPGLYRRWMTDKRDQMYRLIVANIRKGKTQGLYREELIGEVIAALYVSRMERLEREDTLVEPDVVSDEFVREVFIYHLHGICNRKGLEYLEQKKTFSHDN